MSLIGIDIEETLSNINDNIIEISTQLYDMSENRKYISFLGGLFAFSHASNANFYEDVGYYLEYGTSYDGGWNRIIKFDTLKDVCEFIHYINGGESKDILDRIKFIEREG